MTLSCYGDSSNGSYSCHLTVVRDQNMLHEGLKGEQRDLLPSLAQAHLLLLLRALWAMSMVLRALKQTKQMLLEKQQFSCSKRDQTQPPTPLEWLPPKQGVSLSGVKSSRTLTASTWVHPRQRRTPEWRRVQDGMPVGMLTLMDIKECRAISYARRLIKSTETLSWGTKLWHSPWRWKAGAKASKRGQRMGSWIVGTPYSPRLPPTPRSEGST